MAAIERGPEQGIREALNELLQLPSRALTDLGASRGRARRVNTRLNHIDAGEQPGEPNANQQPRPRRPQPAKSKAAARAHHHLTLGSISRAAKSLEALPIADPTEETLEMLRKLHPSAPPPPAPAPTVAAVEVTLEVLKKVLRVLPRGSAAGLSGWTYEHIKAATKTPDSAVHATLRLINAIVKGKLPHLPELLDSTLIGLEKPEGRGIRPIAVGEVWFRLAGLCAMASCPGAGHALAPQQLGVVVRGGSQIIGHAISSAIATNPDCVIVQLDWTNAFNNLKREAMLAAIAKR